MTDDEHSLFDTTAEQVESGWDMQGIPWETTAWSRGAYRVRFVLSFVYFL